MRKYWIFAVLTAVVLCVLLSSCGASPDEETAESDEYSFAYTLTSIPNPDSWFDVTAVPAE